MKYVKPRPEGNVIKFSAKASREENKILKKPHFRSVKSVAVTRFVKYLTKCRRFLRGFLRILFSSRLALALNLMTLARKDVFFLRRHAFAQIKT